MGATRAQWGAIMAGALAGFATTFILGTLGMAIGMTAGKAVSEGAETGQVTTGYGVASGIWWLVTVALTGLVGGAVLGRMARSDRAYFPGIFGTLTWISGVLIVLVLMALGLGGVVSGVGAGGFMGRGMEEQTAQTTAGVGIAAAWVLLVSEIIGLGVTVLAARRWGPRYSSEHEAVIR
ncbi:MAG: hypothetical protein HYY16_11625 [Planctomycetes bacterium]|nr:hypothetical protein [Planctomycetota bacterium]